MKVFKFGGASVSKPDAVRNAAGIIEDHASKGLLVVVSAMGKTTNALEAVLRLSTTGQHHEEIQKLWQYHYDMAQALVGTDHAVQSELKALFDTMTLALEGHADPDCKYDQVVSHGELFSTKILAAFLQSVGVPAVWVDARQYVVSDSNYREGKVDWAATRQRMKSLTPMLADQVVITQGFIASDPAGLTVTLGRDGSDYSAAIFAACLGAESVTIWKDVPGVMNADPKRIPTARIFHELPFKEAAEMTYFGASVIHPKTIKPLANQSIPLYVKNFDDPTLEGTIIHECYVDRLPPLVVFKENQCLISCKVTDYSFINEHQMGTIFNVLSAHKVKINVMQNSAITFSFCVDFQEARINRLIEALSRDFEVYYNTGLTLITVKNYDAHTFQEYHSLDGVLLEQSSRSTLQVLVKG